MEKTYTVTYPLVVEYILLGKATKLGKSLEKDTLLSKYLDCYGPKYVVMKFPYQEVKDYYKKTLLNIPEIKKGIKNKLIKID